MKKWKGDAAALKWIRSGPFLDVVHEIEKTDRGSVAQLIQGLALLVRERHADELVWDLLPDPQPGRFADNFWLQRTIVLLFNPRLATAQRKTALRQHYQGAGSSHYHELGKLLLGRLDEQKAAKLATDPEKACEVSYYLGVKAEAEGRLQDATAWYRNGVESAHPGWAEYHWSYAALRRLESSGKTLRRLEAEHAARKG